MNRSLLLLLAVALVFFPSALDWATTVGSAWYRPYLMWGLAVLLVYWLQRKRPNHDT